MRPARSGAGQGAGEHQAAVGQYREGARFWAREARPGPRYNAVHMSSLADVFRVLNAMCAAHVVDQYAIGGATAVLFYAEPARTYDVDVFAILPSPTGELSLLSGIYAWAHARGFAALGEHVLIHGVPVQFFPTHDALTEEAVADARELDYEGIKVRVIDPEHLVALALRAGGARRRERAWQLFEAGQVDRDRLRTILARHDISVEIPDDV